MFRDTIRRLLMSLSDMMSARREHQRSPRRRPRLHRRRSGVALHAVIQREGDWYVAWVEELPGANTQGETLEEVRKNLQEAVALIIESNREDARRAATGQDVRREPFQVAV
jgi:predicted RNase H-like HicB family nuclease